MFNHFYQNRLHNFVIKPQSKSSSYSRMIRPLFLKSFYLQWALNSSVKPKKKNQSYFNQTYYYNVLLVLLRTKTEGWWMPAWLQLRSISSPSKQAPTLAPTTSSSQYVHKKKKQRLRLCAAASASAEALEALEQGGSSRREVRQMAPTALCLHVGVCIVPTLHSAYMSSREYGMSCERRN